MLSSLLAGLVGIFAREIVSYLGNLAKVWVQDKEQAKADHETAINQSAQDNQKAEGIKSDSKSEDVDKAIDDSIRHL